ncbi:MAG: methyl-accepting chemotaxis protein [Thermoleophilia bacterium]
MKVFSRLKLAPKLILAFLAAGVIPMLIVAFISLRVSGDLKKQAQATQQDQAATVLDVIDRNLFERYGDVQAFAQSVPARNMDPKGLQAWMDRMMGTYTPIYNLMVVADLKGRVIAANTVDIDGKPVKTGMLLGTDVAQEPWFKDTIADYKPTVTRVDDLATDALAAKVYGDGSPQSYAMLFSYPIVNDAGKIVGVWSNRFNADVVTQIFTDKLGDRKGEQFALMNTAGTVVEVKGDGNLKIGVDGKGVEGFTAAQRSPSGVVETTELGTGDAVLQGYAKSKGYSTYPGVGWTLTANRDAKIALAAANNAKRIILLVGVLIALAIAGIAWFLARSFSRPIISLKAEMEDIAERRDLMQRIEVTRGDEIGEMGRSFNRMMSQFHDIIREVGENARRLNEEADRSGQASNEAGRAAIEIASTIETVATSATEQADQARLASEAVAEIARGAQEVAMRGEAATAAAVQADDAAAGGSETLQQATVAMREIQAAVLSAGEVVKGLGAKGQEIGLIVDTISEIAAQTNLLALNAAIEAARAGEQGRGFAVVADEVRKLAEEAANAATSIGQLIDDVQAESRRAVDAMDDGITAVDSGTARMSAVDEAFAVIRAEATRVRDDISQVAAAAQELQAGTDSAEAALQEMVRLAESNAAASEQVAASAEETGAAAEEVSNATTSVGRSSTELSEMVGVFRVWNPGEPDRRSRIRELEERDPRD